MMTASSSAHTRPRCAMVVPQVHAQVSFLGLPHPPALHNQLKKNDEKMKRNHKVRKAVKLFGKTGQDNGARHKQDRAGRLQKLKYFKMTTDCLVSFSSTVKIS